MKHVSFLLRRFRIRDQTENQKQSFLNKNLLLPIKNPQMWKSYLFCFWEINLTREGWKLRVIFNYVSFGQERGFVADFIAWWSEGLAEKKTFSLFTDIIPFFERFLLSIFRDYHRKFSREENNCISRCCWKHFIYFYSTRIFFSITFVWRRENRGIHLLFSTQTILPHNQNKISKKKTSWIFERIKSSSLGNSGGISTA